MSKLQLAVAVALAGTTPLALAGTALPEPGTWALVALAAGIGYLVTRRRK